MASNNLQIEKLSGRDNYNTWKFAVRTYLEHEELWECVDPTKDPTTEKIDPKKDLKAKSKIILLVEPTNFVHIECATTAREVWEQLQKVFEDSGLSRKVGLLRDLINTSLDSCANVEEYVNKIMSTAHKLRNIGFKVEDEWLGTLMLAGLPEIYKPMIMGIESSGIKISSDFIKTKLLQEVKVSESSAFYTKHKYNCNNQPKPKGKGPRCFNCNKYGHYKAQCNLKKSTNNNVFSAIFSAYNTLNQDDWYIDSGATMHMTRRSDWMYDLQPPPIQKITVANNDTVSVQQIGKVNIQTVTSNDEHRIQVRDVLLIPDLSANLLSVSQLTKNGCKVEFTDSGCHIYNSKGDLVAMARRTNNMYKLNTVGTGTACAVFPKESKADIETWHRRMAHLNMADVYKLSKCTEGINISTKNTENSVCIPCCEGKQTRLPFPHSGSRANGLLEIVHSDLCGPMETPSAGGAKYFITFVDDYSRKVYVYFLKNKLDIKSVFERFKNEVENETDRRIKILRTDNGKEYCNNMFLKCLADSGIKHQTSTPYTPEQNGLAERMNRTLVERAKAMLFDANLKKEYWAEAVATAAYIVNRSPSRVLAEVTPFEKWSGKKPNISHLKIFGSKAMVHIPKQNRLKWDRKSRELIFVGYCETTKGYRLHDPKTRKTVISRDVIFIENIKKDIKESLPLESVPSPQFTEVPLSSQINHSENSNCDQEREETLHIPSSQNDTLSPQNSDISFDSCTQNEDDKDETYYPSSSEDLDSVEPFENKMTLRPRNRGVHFDNTNFLCVAQFSDPLTVEEALSCAEAQHWRDAMDEEYKALMENNTWKLVSLPSSKRAIPCKWVFKTKTNEKGDVVKYKARLVIKGCSQKKGIDYNEVFSPVVRFSSLRYLFALAAKYDFDILQMDAISAFLQGDIEEEVYMVQPSHYEKGEEVCLLQKSLYGLKQASRQWNKKLDSALKGLGLEQSHLDPCIYFKIVDEKDMLFVAIYVDDLMIFTNQQKSADYFKNELSKRFKMKDLGEICYCLGMHVERDRTKGKIYLDQRKYILEVLNKFGLSDCKPVNTPLDMNTKIKGSTEEGKILHDIPYQEAIGCLLYISQVTRPDISFAINMLSKYNNKPEMHHWVALKRVMRYLKGTQDYRLTFKQTQDEELTHGYCDADWANSEDDRRSVTGYIFLLQGGSISWNSRRQATVALSTTEAEYMALSTCVQEALWLRQFQEDFWPQLKNKPLTIYSDNQSSIKLSGSDGYHSRTKHIDVRHHFVRDKVIGGLIEVQYIQTDQMVADALTKATSFSKLHFCSSMMGICLREDVG